MVSSPEVRYGTVGKEAIGLSLNINLVILVSRRCSSRRDYQILEVPPIDQEP